MRKSLLSERQLHGDPCAARDGDAAWGSEETTWKRRGVVGFLFLLPAMVMCCRPEQAAVAGGFDAYTSLLSEVVKSPDTITSVLGYKEYLEFPIGGNAEEKAPITAAPSTLRISSRASDLIVFFEVSDTTTYSARYQHPTLPPGDSGITIGIGYDIGYSSPSLLRSDWQGFIADKDTLETLMGLCGRTGPRATPLLGSVQNIKIPYDVAYQQFTKSEQPKYVGLTERSLPNFSRLSEDGRGALVSLVYNRGPSFRQSGSVGDRYTEMRNILALMSGGSKENFAAVPNEIRHMARLWADPALNMQGLVKRRNLEAALFEAGL